MLSNNGSYWVLLQFLALDICPQLKRIANYLRGHLRARFLLGLSLYA